MASSYELVLTEVNTGVVYKFKGNWGSHNIVTLQTGIYDVEGVISDEFLTLTGCSENNEPIKIQFTEQEVRELITQKGSKDF